MNIANYEITLDEETDKLILKECLGCRSYSFDKERGVAELIANLIEDDINEALGGHDGFQN